MTYGLRCWDVNGNVILEVTDRLARVVGMYRTTGTKDSPEDGVIALPSNLVLSATNKVFVMLISGSNDMSAIGGVDSETFNVISINGNIIKFSKLISNFIYGVA